MTDQGKSQQKTSTVPYESRVVIIAEIAFAALLLYFANHPLDVDDLTQASLDTANLDPTSIDQSSIDQSSIDQSSIDKTSSNLPGDYNYVTVLYPSSFQQTSSNQAIADQADNLTVFETITLLDGQVKWIPAVHTSTSDFAVAATEISTIANTDIAPEHGTAEAL